MTETKEKKLKIRSMIRAPKGYVLLAADLSAAESWVVAHLADDPNMKLHLRNNQLHEYAACLCYELPFPSPVTKDQRYIGKKMNHGCGYGATAFKVCEVINKEGGVSVSLRQVKRYYELWHRGFRINHYWSSTVEEYNLNKTLTTPYGFTRKFWGLRGDDLYKELYAFKPQSTVSDHMKGMEQDINPVRGGLLAITEDIIEPSRGEIRLIQEGHDSLLMEVPEKNVLDIAEQVKNYLLRPLIVNGEEFTIPVDCEYYPERWTENPVSL